MERELREIKQSLRTGDVHNQDVEDPSNTNGSVLKDLQSSIISEPETLETAPMGRTVGGIFLSSNLQQDLITEYA